MTLTTIPDQKLRQKSIEVKLPLTDEDKNIAEQLIAYVDESQKPGSTLRPGVGIAAVQLGYLKRMFYINLGFEEDNVRELLINPKMIKMRGRAALGSGEGCLSVPEETPNQDGLVHRAEEIIIEGYSYFKDAIVKYRLRGFPAIVFQHEFDHLEGKLFIDRIDNKDPKKELDREIII